MITRRRELMMHEDSPFDLMRAQPSTQFELPPGPVFDARVGRFETCALVAQVLE